MDDNPMAVRMQWKDVNLRAVGAQWTGGNPRAEITHYYPQDFIKATEGQRTPTSRRTDCSPMALRTQRTDDNPMVGDTTDGW